MMIKIMLTFCFIAGTGDPCPRDIVMHQERQTRPTVFFPHGSHAERTPSCTACHHTDQDGGSDVTRCGACHGPAAADGILSLKDAYHKQCIGCHRINSGRGFRSPLYCGECHRKR